MSATVPDMDSVLKVLDRVTPERGGLDCHCPERPVVLPLLRDAHLLLYLRMRCVVSLFATPPYREVPVQCWVEGRTL